jgi:hypothetical protein
VAALSHHLSQGRLLPLYELMPSEVIEHH